MKKCNNCGTEHSDESLFCSKCGVRLEGSEAETPAPKPEENKDETLVSKPEENKDESPVSEPEENKTVEEKVEVKEETVEGVPAPMPKAMAPPTDRFAAADQTIGRVEQPAEQESQKTEVVEQVEQAIEQPVEQPVEAPASQSIEQPAEQPVEQSTQPVQPEQNTTSDDYAKVMEKLADIDQAAASSKAVTGKNNKKNMIIAVVAVGIVLIIASIIGIIIANINMNKNTKQTSNTNTSQQTPAQPEPAKKTVAVTVGDWVFQVPEDYSHTNKNGGLMITADDEWAMSIKYNDMSYDLFSSKVDENTIDLIKQEFAKNGIEVANYGTIAIDGVDYLWFDANVSNTSVKEANGTKSIILFTAAPDGKVFQLGLTNFDNSLDHGHFEDVAEIISTAEPAEASSSSNSTTNSTNSATGNSSTSIF